jgi:hypothetical protein
MIQIVPPYSARVFTPRLTLDMQRRTLPPPDNSPPPPDIEHHVASRSTSDHWRVMPLDRRRSSVGVGRFGLSSERLADYSGAAIHAPTSTYGYITRSQAYSWGL